MFQYILIFLNVVGIVTNSLLIAFTSTYYQSIFSSLNISYLIQNEYLLIIVFEVSSVVFRKRKAFIINFNFI